MRRGMDVSWPIGILWVTEGSTFVGRLLEERWSSERVFLVKLYIIHSTELDSGDPRLRIRFSRQPDTASIYFGRSHPTTVPGRWLFLLKINGQQRYFCCDLEIDQLRYILRCIGNHRVEFLCQVKLSTKIQALISWIQVTIIRLLKIFTRVSLACVLMWDTSLAL